MIFYKKRTGQSLIEVLIAVAIGAIMITAAATVIVPTLRINSQTNKAQVGAAVAKELLENVRVWAEGGWGRITSLATTSVNHYYLNTTSSPFSAVSGNQLIFVATTTYTRYFYVDDVYRDGSDLIVTSNGSVDPSTKKITIVYSWSQSATTTMAQYITRNRANIFIQTDWSGGPGYNGPVTSTNNRYSSSSSNINYSSTTGSIQLDL